MPDIENISSRWAFYSSWECVSRKKDNNASKYLVFQRTTIYIILEHHFIGGKKVNAVRLGQKQHTKRGQASSESDIKFKTPVYCLYKEGNTINPNATYIHLLKISPTFFLRVAEYTKALDYVLLVRAKSKRKTLMLCEQRLNQDYFSRV